MVLLVNRKTLRKYSRPDLAWPPQWLPRADCEHILKNNCVTVKITGTSFLYCFYSLIKVEQNEDHWYVNKLARISRYCFVAETGCQWWNLFVMVAKNDFNDTDLIQSILILVCLRLHSVLWLSIIMVHEKTLLGKVFPTWKT